MRGSSDCNYISTCALFITLVGLTTACGMITSAADECERRFIPVSLIDSDFEELGAGWTSEWVTRPPICNTQQIGLSPTSGQNAACFGIANSSNQKLSQTITLPFATTRIRLIGQRCFITDEVGDRTADIFTVELRDPRTSLPIATLASFSNLDARPVCSWERFEASAVITDESELAMLYMESQLDSQYVTSFFLDRLALEAFGCD